MAFETNAFQDLGLNVNTGGFPKLPRGSKFTVAIDVLRNVKKVAKGDVLTFERRAGSSST